VKEKMDKISQKARETANKQTTGFLDFVREQGVITLAVGFIIGGAVTKLVNSFVVDIINPFLGLVLGKVNLANATFQLGAVTIAWGNFVSALIDFFVIAAVVYFGFKFLRLDRVDIDKKKRDKEAEVEAKKEEAAEKSEQKPGKNTKQAK